MWLKGRQREKLSPEEGIVCAVIERGCGEGENGSGGDSKPRKLNVLRGRMPWGGDESAGKEDLHQKGRRQLKSEAEGVSRRKRKNGKG